MLFSSNTARTSPPGLVPYTRAPSSFPELSSGRSRLKSLFLDEGFGTLDSETLDAALNALESLRLSGRTVGVISHIEQLTRGIPVMIDVKRTGVGTSTIQVKG
ncbi:MAG: hypothetical protein K8R08_01740 [Methanosarcinales archaeon]|nr:hypothetical protein [Methanosarcinales archaeon]